MRPPRINSARVGQALLRSATAFAVSVSALAIHAQGVTPPQQSVGPRARIVGTVTDVATKAPIPGVNIFIVGTPITVSTGPDGRFIIPSVPPGIQTVEARRIGYAPVRRENLRLIADSVLTINLSLSVAATRLDQVTTSGTMDATSVAKSTISVEKITSENIPVPPTSSAAGLVAGKVAGVAVTRNSGAPGAGVNIVVRTPISGITDGGTPPAPLFVVDGVFLNQGQNVTTRDIEGMDIESIEVIKGAAAASLYGSRAAAGVIAITTKRGRGLELGSNQFQVRGEAGTDQFLTRLEKNQHHQFRQNDAGQWLDLNGAVVPRAQRVPTQLGFMDQSFKGPTYNHADLFFRPGSYNTQQLQVQGNSAATNYNLAYTRTDNPAILQWNEGYLRQTLRLNVDSRINEKLNVGVSANHTRGDLDASAPSFNNFYRIDTDVNLKEVAPFPANNGFPYIIVPDSVTLFENPLYTQYRADNVLKNGRTLLNVNGVYRPTAWFSFSADANYDRGDNNQTNYTPRNTPLVTTTGGLNPSTGSLVQENIVNEGFIGTATGSLTKGFGDLTVRLSQRGEVRKETNNRLTTTGTIFATEGLKAMSQATVRTTTNNISDFRVIGSITSLGLSLKERYIADVLVRREGNSLFGRANRWNTFGRASAAWLLSEESWFPLRDFNVFKMRYSYGVTGLNPGFTNQYEAMTADGAGGIRRNALSGTLGNVNVSPTYTKEEELGFDVAYKSRLSGTLTFVRNSSQDVFVSVPAPAVSGYAVQVTNPAQLGGTIIEATLQGALLTNPKGLRWDVLFTGDKSWFSTQTFGRTCFDDGLQYKCDGIPISEMWGNMIIEEKSQLPVVHANSQGQFDVNDEGYVVPVGAGNTFRDGVAKQLWGTTVNIDGVGYRWGHPIPRRTETGVLWYGKMGDSRPDLRYGLQNQFRYGNLRLFVQMNGQIGGNVYANSNQTYYASGDHPDVDQSGKAEELKKPVTYYNAVSNNNNLFLKRFVQSGTHLQLAELLFGYTLESKRFRFLERLGFARAQVDLIGRNLGIFSNYTGLNVMGGSPTVRIDDATYPQTRTLTGVITLTF